MSQTSLGDILEALNNKVDRDLNNLGVVDYVIDYQEGTAANNYTWYRKYSSGWIEQGGETTVTFNSEAAPEKYINLPVTMANEHYFSVTNGATAVELSSWCTVRIVAVSRTQISLRLWALNGKISGTTSPIQWKVEGFAA